MLKIKLDFGIERRLKDDPLWVLSRDCARIHLAALAKGSMPFKIDYRKVLHV